MGSACRAAPDPDPEPLREVWREVASWSGRGDQQLHWFAIDRFEWRIHWTARNEAPPGTGRLKVLVQSSDSGRVIDEPVDHRGVGGGTVYITEDPRRYYLTVESTGVDWRITVEEPDYVAAR
jgi:hypothetical protein